MHQRGGRGACLSAALCAFAASAAAQTHEVLLLQPSEQLAPEYAGIEAGLRSEFANTSVDATRVYREFVDLDFGQPVDRQIFADYLRAKYSDVGIDAVVALSDEARRFVVEHRDAIGDVPAVFTTEDPAAIDTIPKSSS